MSTRASSWVVVALALGLAACAGASSAAAQRRPSPPRVRLPTVRLLEAGAEPRAPLRYRIAPNATATVEMRMEMTMRISMGAQALPSAPMPAMVGRMTFRVTSVGTDGTVRYGGAVESFEPAPGYAGPPQLLTAVRTALATLVGTTYTGAMSSRGFVLDAQISVPPNADANARQTIDSLRDSLRQLAAPLPAEPVGRGARWRVTMPIDAGGISMQQVALYTLDEVRGERGHVQVAITQTARPQALRTPGMPAGTTARLESLRGSGSATAELDLTRLVSTTHTRVVSDTTSTITAGTQAQRMTTHVEIDATFTPLQAPAPAPRSSTGQSLDRLLEAPISSGLGLACRRGVRGGLCDERVRAHGALRVRRGPPRA